MLRTQASPELALRSQQKEREKQERLAKLHPAISAAFVEPLSPAQPLPNSPSISTAAVSPPKPENTPDSEKVAILRTALHSKNSKLDEVTTQRDDITRQHADITRQHAEITQQLDKITRQCNDQLQKIEKHCKDIVALEKENAALKAKANFVEKLSNLDAKQEENMRVIKQESEQSRKQASETKLTLQALVKAVNVLPHSCHLEIVQENSKLKTQLEKAQADHSRAQADHTTDKKSLLEDHDKTRAKLTSAEAQLLKRASDLDAMSKALKDLQRISTIIQKSLQSSGMSE